MQTIADVALKNINIVLAVPVLFSLLLLLNDYIRHRQVDMRRALSLGFTLPLAIAYTVVLGGPFSGYGEPLLGQLSWRIGGVLLAAPQVLILYVMGLVVWVRAFRSDRTRTHTWLVVLSIAAIGHIWTVYVMGAFL
ncbi:MAG: hypothetical protein HXY30_19465 [Pseudorhodoplanes sp.]|nr:hypothetical protein [Pseudorhodoplanes sp.]